MKKAILLAAYGSANLHSQRAISAFEARCRQRFPGLTVRWAITSLLLRERMANMRRKSDSVFKALARLWHEKFEHAAIQPLQAIPGHEYQQVCEAVERARAEYGMRCAVGAPLLGVGSDAARLARALVSHLPDQRQAGEDVVLMGHGARHAACRLYDDLASELGKLDNHVHLGTMSLRDSAGDGLDKIMPVLVSDRVWLMPLLSVVGKHAINDMAGEDANSWRSRINDSGHHCLPVLRGIAEYALVADIWLDNLAQAVDLLEK